MPKTTIKTKAKTKLQDGYFFRLLPPEDKCKYGCNLCTEAYGYEGYKGEKRYSKRLVKLYRENHIAQYCRYDTCPYAELNKYESFEDFNEEGEKRCKKLGIC